MPNPEEAPMISNFSQSLLPSLNAVMEHNSTEKIMEYDVSQNGAGFLYNSSYIPKNHSSVLVTAVLTLFICLPGFVGNGIVIWLLGFRIKRNPFTTYILNLSIADFGVLTGLTVFSIFWILHSFCNISFSDSILLLSLFTFISLFTFTVSQLLLTVISIDRCVCLFFPLWHRCHRPPQLSTAVCVIIWIIAFFILAMEITVFATIQYYQIWFYPFFLNAVVSMPIMCVSTVAMSIKVCLRSAPLKRGKLLTAIWLTLVFFLLFAFPINAIYGHSAFLMHDLYLYHYADICAALNSAINPMIYFLVGRGKRGRSSKRIKEVLEKLFKEEEDCTQEHTASTETWL